MRSRLPWPRCVANAFLLPLACCARLPAAPNAVSRAALSCSALPAACVLARRNGVLESGQLPVSYGHQRHAIPPACALQAVSKDAEDSRVWTETCSGFCRLPTSVVSRGRPPLRFASSPPLPVFVYPLYLLRALPVSCRVRTCGLLYCDLLPSSTTLSLTCSRSMTTTTTGPRRRYFCIQVRVHRRL